MFEAIVITIIVVAVLFTAGWLHALSKELFDHSRAIMKTEVNIARLTDTVSLHDKTLDRLIDRTNQLERSEQ